MATFYPSAAFGLLCMLCFADGFILNDDVTLRPHVPKLPQYSSSGKSLVLIGGHLWDNNTEIYQTVIRLAGGGGKAKIGIINAASADPLDSFIYYKDLFLRHGALEVNRIPIDVNHTGDSAGQNVIDLIYSQTGFFFGGGDQARVTQSFLGAYGELTPPLLALHQMFDSGAVIAGTSAGCTCQTAQLMIEGGVSYDALLYGSVADVDPGHGNTSPVFYLTTGGLDFVKGYVMDSHFAQRGREGRMIRMLSDTMHLARGSSRGIGVDENTALVVTHADTNNAQGQVIGVGGVSVFDLSRSQVHKGQYFHISGVSMSYITHGDVIFLANQSITFSSSKQPMRGIEAYNDVLTTDDVFYGGKSDSSRKPEFVRIATSVFDAHNGRTTHGFTHETHPRFRVDLSAVGHDAKGYVERKSSFHSDITSYQNLQVEIYQG